MNPRISLLLFGLFLAEAVYAADTVLPPSPADAQIKAADVILFFDGPSDISFERPNQDRKPFPLAALPDRIAAATQRRELIVVIMSKPTRMWPDDKFRAAVDDLEARLRGSGFKKVVFHLASGTYPTPIYRE
jgi:hypothetical protein